MTWHRGAALKLGWPTEAQALETLQRELAGAEPPEWTVPPDPTVVGCFVCFGRGESGTGRAGEPGWAGAAAFRGRRRLAAAAAFGAAGAQYLPGLLALREGPLLEKAVRSLSIMPALLLVNGSGRDHPRRAGMALHLGAVLDLPSLGLTNRPLVASGRWPEDRRGATSPLRLEGEVIGAWVRTRQGVPPLVVTPGWRVTVDQAVEAALAACGRYRTPEPLREARRLARTARGNVARTLPETQ